MSRTAIIWDERYTLHEMGYLHPETPRRLIAIKEVLDGDGVGREVERLEPRDATFEELAYIHDKEYINYISETEGVGHTALDPDTSANAYTWQAARLSAGGLLVCTEAVQEGRFKNSFAFVRPPGHHAERDRAMGFCIFNNVAIAAEWLIKKAGLDRVAIVDFDTHHGNGTQNAFYDRSDVFFSSIHRSPFYPGTGAAEETGEGEGKGATLNIPLDVGSGDDDFRRALGERIFPAVGKFAPQFILVSAGYDAHADDPLGGMRVTTKGFRSIMNILINLSRETCDGKLVATLEGGYNLKALAESVEGQLEEMCEASNQ